MFNNFFRNREVATIRRWQQEQYNNRWLYTGVDLLHCGFAGVLIGLLVGMALVIR